MLTIIETDQEGSASETEEGLGTIQEAEEYGRSTLCTLYKSIHWSSTVSTVNVISINMLSLNFLQYMYIYMIFNT